VRRLLLLLICAVVALMPARPVVAQPQDWAYLPYRNPHLQFNEVLQSIDTGQPTRPFFCRFYDGGELSRPDDYPVDPLLVINFVRHLGLADRWYVRQGFPNPTNRPIGNRALDGNVPGDPVNFAICNLLRPVLFAVGSCYTDNSYPVADPNAENSAIQIGRHSNLLAGPGLEPIVTMGAAHEFAHLLQNNLLADKSILCGLPEWPNSGWIIEGTADAMSIRYAEGHHTEAELYPYRYASTDPNARFFRRLFMLRPYYVALDWEPGTTQASGSPFFLIDYATNGFWYHVTERYLNDTGGNLRPVMDYNRIANQNMIWYLDRFLDARDGRMHGLEHVFPQFLAEIAQWHRHRFRGMLSKSDLDTTVFDGCTTVAVSDGSPSATVTVPMVPVSGACIEVTTNSPAQQQTLTLAVRNPEGLANEVFLAYAETSGLPQDFDCYREIETRGARAYPCVLFHVHQGRTSPNASPTRYFTISDAQPVSGPVTYRLVTSYVPRVLRPAEPGIARARRSFELTFTLETAAVAGQPARAGYAEKPGPGSPVRGSQPPGDLADAIVGSVDNAFARTGLTEAELAEVCAVERATPGFNLVRQAVTVSDELDETGDAILVRITPDVGYAPGATGTFSVSAAGHWEGADHVPDLADPGSITISRNDEDMISFEGVANTCLAAIPAYLENGTCAGARRSFGFSGHVALPSESECGTRPREDLTPQMLRLQELRLGRLGLARQPLEPLPPMLRAGDSDPVSPAPGGPAAATPEQCPATAAAGCTCSCALEACISSGRTEASPLCRLSCGSSFQQCTE